MTKKGHYDFNKIETGGFIQIPKPVLRSTGYAKLSSQAVKLTLDLLIQYNGNNNGDLCAPFSLMRKKNWKSKGTLNRAIKELLISDFIEVTRRGGRNKCSLYSMTFLAIDECNGKLDIKATTKPKSTWKKHEPLQDIAQLQKDKFKNDERKLMKSFFDLTKRSGDINLVTPTKDQEAHHYTQ
jgi:hypothetical protein